MVSQYAKIYDQIFMEWFDINDEETRKTYVSVNEADKSQMIVSLTSRLYDKIMEKVDDIDFGSIPASRGDITKIENYESMMECLDILRNILIQYSQPTQPVDTVYTAIENIKSREKLFSRAFALGAELPIVLYNTMVLSIVSSISFLIAGCIEYVKNPGDDSFTVSLDKAAYHRTSQNLLFEDLARFNQACSKREFDEAMESVIKGSVNPKQLTGIDALGITLSIGVIIALSKQIIPILQELVYFFFHSRQSVSDYFAVQADLLTINASNVIYKSDIDDGEKKKIIDKQTKIAGAFRKISNFFDIEYKKAERDSKRMAADEKRKYKVSDVQTVKPDSADAAVSSLF